MNYSITSLILLVIVTVASCQTIAIPKNSIITRKDKIIELEFPSNLGQGYQWRLIDTSKFTIVKHSSRENPDTTISTDIEMLALRPKVKKGQYRIVLYKLRPFDPISDTLNSQKIFKTIIIK